MGWTTGTHERNIRAPPAIPETCPSGEDIALVDGAELRSHAGTAVSPGPRLEPLLTAPPTGGLLAGFSTGDRRGPGASPHAPAGLARGSNTLASGPGGAALNK